MTSEEIRKFLQNAHSDHCLLEPPGYPQETPPPPNNSPNTPQTQPQPAPAPRRAATTRPAVQNRKKRRPSIVFKILKLLLYTINSITMVIYVDREGTRSASTQVDIP